jgi:hypothetical protein
MLAATVPAAARYVGRHRLLPLANSSHLDTAGYQLAISAARLPGHTAGLAQHEDYGAGEPDEQVVDSGLAGQRVLVGPGRA